MKLNVGDKAPDFTLKNQDGEDVSLSSLTRKGLVLLAFYPGDFTSVCTNEMVCFREDFSEFQGLDCQIIGISTDDQKSHKDFKTTHKFPFDLLTDPDAAVSARYGAKLPLVKKANRATFIIDEQGRIGYAYKETLPVFKRSNEELLAAVKALRQKSP